MSIILYIKISTYLVKDIFNQAHILHIIHGDMGAGGVISEGIFRFGPILKRINQIKFVFSKKAKKIDEIFINDLTLTT